MKKIYSDKIVNVSGTDLFDATFVYEYLQWDKVQDRKVIFLADEAEKYKNISFLDKIREKPAMWGNIYAPEMELKIFKDFFDDAIAKNQKIHIVGVTLGEEIEILETYYQELGFLREDINCFDPDFSVPLVTVSVCIENLMWKGSDYKRMGEKIFFNPPIRESGETKAMFKGISRGVMAGIFIKNFDESVQKFLQQTIVNEDIMPLAMGKILCFNLEKVGIKGTKKEFLLSY